MALPSPSGIETMTETELKISKAILKLCEEIAANSSMRSSSELQKVLQLVRSYVVGGGK